MSYSHDVTPGIEFAQLEKAPDEIFLDYIKYYLLSGGTELRGMCSLSSTMNKRCQQFRPLIEEWIEMSQTDWQRDQTLYKTIQTDDVSKFEKIRDNKKFSKLLQAPRWEWDPNGIPRLLEIFNDHTTFPQSIAMMQKIFNMIPAVQFPNSVIEKILVDPLVWDDEQRQLNIELAFHMISQPQVRETILEQVSQGNMSPGTLNTVLFLIEIKYSRKIYPIEIFVR